MRAFVFCFLMVGSIQLMAQTTDTNSLELQQKIVEEYINEYGKSHINTAEAYKDLGMIYLRTGDNNRALEYVHKALQIEEKNYEKRNTNIADSHLKLSLIYIRIGYNEKANEHRNKAALKINIDTTNHSLPENLHNRLNPIHYNIENYQYIDPRINTVGNVFIISWWVLETLGGGTGRSPTLNTAKTKQEKVIRKVHRKLARKDYKEARQILEANIYTLSYPSVRMNLGYYNGIARLYKYVGSYDAAMNVCKKGISKLKEQLSDDRRKISKAYDKMTGKHTDKKRYLAHLYNLSGEIYHVNGNYAGAIEFYIKAQVICSEIKATENEIVVIYNNIGNAHYALGNYDKATRFYDTAYSLLKSGRNNILLAETYSNKANLFYSMGDYKRALKFYTKSIKITKANTRKKAPQRVKSYVGASNTHYVLGNFQEALEFQKKALQILERKFGESHQYTGLSYSKIGAIYYSLGSYKQALEFQEKAMEILSESLKSNHIQKASVFNNFAIAQFAMGEYGEAMTYQEIAAGIIEKKLGNKHHETLEYKSNLAEIYKTIGKQELADSLYQIIIPQTIKSQNNSYLFLPDKQRLEYLNTVKNIYSNFYAFALAYRDEETVKLATDLLLNTKSLALDYSISFKEIIIQMDDEQLTEFLEELTTLNRQLIGVEMSSSGTSKSQQRIASLRQQRDDLTTKLLRNQILKNKLNREITTWQNLQNQLNDDEAIIDFLVINEGRKELYCAIIIRKNGTPSLIPLTNESNANTIVNEKNYIADEDLRNQLYEQLWQPLESHLKDITTVHLSPSGALHRIPFEALQNDEEEYLSERFAFHYYSSMRDFAKVQPQQKSYKDAVLMGHILYDLKDSLQYKALAMRGDLRDKVRPLKGTLEEVNRIDTICQQANLPTTLLTIDKPTEEVVQFLTGENSPSIYHFATHGVFLNPTDTLGSESFLRKRLRQSSDPLKRSALMLYGANHTWVKSEKILNSKEDGILTALEVTALDLQNTNLVVLSACSTGLGNVHNTEGVFGLQRAFKLAGVDYVVASLWDVDDGATKDLMVAFYKNLLELKQDPATALRNAKHTFIKDGDDPELWAGFILIE